MNVVTVKISENAPVYAWYARLEGRTFEVYRHTSSYIIKEDYDRGHNATWRHINFDDCEEV